MIKEDLHFLPKIYTEIQSHLKSGYWYLGNPQIFLSKKRKKKLPTILRAYNNTVRYA